MHTLNEIKRSYSGTTFAALGAAISELTGWEYDSANGNLYIGKTKKFYMAMSASPFNVYFKSDVTDGWVILGSQQGFPISSGFTLWVHKSTNEKVTYLGMANSQNAASPTGALRFVLTENSNGDEVLFRGTVSSNFTAGTKTMSAAFNVNPAVLGSGGNINSSFKYGIAKYIDVWNGADFPELYWVYGSPALIANNHLVRFDNGQVMRIIPEATNYYTMFAFPVSD